MYKENRAITARLNQTMQEWVLTHSGGEPETAAARRRARTEATGAAHREWESLLAENAPLAFRVARGVLRNDADAEDIAQEALLRAYRRFERLRERTCFRAWLVRISFRLALDRLRSTKRRQQREAQWVFENSRNSRQSCENSEFQRRLIARLMNCRKAAVVLLLVRWKGIR
jgi:RNA polymerase sigma factor (sigma-70 family)